VSNLNKKIYAKIEAGGTVASTATILFTDGIVMKRSWAGEVRNVFCWWQRRQFRRISGDFGHLRGAKEDNPAGQHFCGTWSRPQRRAVDHFRRLPGLIESAADYLPEARWQRCMVHFYRNVFSHAGNKGPRREPHAQAFMRRKAGRQPNRSKGGHRGFAGQQDGQGSRPR
jgi:hypothetical protein